MPRFPRRQNSLLQSLLPRSKVPSGLPDSFVRSPQTRLFDRLFWSACSWKEDDYDRVTSLFHEVCRPLANFLRLAQSALLNHHRELASRLLARFCDDVSTEPLLKSLLDDARDWVIFARQQGLYVPTVMVHWKSGLFEANGPAYHALAPRGDDAALDGLILQDNKVIQIQCIAPRSADSTPNLSTKMSSRKISESGFVGGSFSP